MMRDREIQELLDERDIRNVLFRYARGIDRLDGELLRSCFHPDAVLIYGQQTDPETFITNGLPGLSRYRLTQHAVSNVLIELDGDAAHVEAYCRATHRLPDTEGGAASDFVWGGRYIDHFERRDGAWRIARRVVVHEWTTITPVHETWAGAATFTQGQRSRDDIVYQC